MPAQRIITSEERENIKRALHYDHVTGTFTWKYSISPRAIIGHTAGCIWRDKYNRQYIVIRYNKQLYRAHRLAWILYYGTFPDGQIDHKNGDGLDNSIENLRVVTHRENSLNQRRRSTNKSGYTGVTWNAPTKSWRAVIMAHGKKIHLGLFTTKEQAAAVRKEAEHNLGFYKNHGSDYEHTNYKNNNA